MACCQLSSLLVQFRDGAREEHVEALVEEAEYEGLLTERMRAGLKRDRCSAYALKWRMETGV